MPLGPPFALPLPPPLGPCPLPPRPLPLDAPRPLDDPRPLPLVFLEDFDLVFSLAFLLEFDRTLFDFAYNFSLAPFAKFGGPFLFKFGFGFGFDFDFDFDFGFGASSFGRLLELGMGMLLPPCTT